MKGRIEIPNYSLFVLMSGFFSACVTCSIKLTNGSLELGQILFVRYLPIALLSLGYLLVKGIDFKPVSFFFTFVRAVSGILAVGFFTLAAQKIPVATAQALFYCSPLFTAVIFCFTAIKKEKLLWLKILPLIPLGLIGVFLINKPHLIPEESPFILCGLASAFFLSFASLALKNLGWLGELPARTIFYFALTCTFVGAGISEFQQKPLIDCFDSPLAWALIIFTLLQQLTVTIGWGRGSTLLNCVFQFFGVPCAVVIGLILFKENLSASEIIGLMILVISETAALWLMKTQKD